MVLGTWYHCCHQRAGWLSKDEKLLEVTNALETVIKQCEQWTDNEQENYSTESANMYEIHKNDVQITAEP